MNRLQSILEEYAKQASCEIKVHIREEGDNLVIRWDHTRGDWKTSHEKEFPKDHLDSRIENYKKKLR